MLPPWWCCRDGAEQLSVDRALRALSRAEVVVMVVDGSDGVTQQVREGGCSNMHIVQRLRQWCGAHDKCLDTIYYSGTQVAGSAWWSVSSTRGRLEGLCPCPVSLWYAVLSGQICSAHTARHSNLWDTV